MPENALARRLQRSTGMNLVKMAASLLLVASTNACVAGPLMAGIGSTVPDEDKLVASDDPTIGSSIRIQTASGVNIEGTTKSTDARSIDVETKSGVVTVDRMSIDTMWHRKGSKALTLGLIGLGIDTAVIAGLITLVVTSYRAPSLWR